MNINPELLLNEILASEEKVKSLVGKDVVMVMGKTGTGKSTLINFLQGRKLKRDLNEENGLETVQLDDNSVMHSPKIGQKSVAETAQPEAYVGSHNNREVHFCDTAGLAGTESEEKKLSVPVANYLAAQYASSVLACIWVSEAQTIRAAKHTEFSSVMERVKNIVNPEKMNSVLSNNTLFYFTKPALLPNGTKYSKQQLQARLPTFRNEIADNQIRTVIETMIAQPGRIFLSDFVDAAGNMDVASRDATYQAITAMANTSIQKSAFKVSLSREQSAQVIAALLVPAHTYLEKYTSYQQATAVIEQAQNAIKIAQDRVSTLTTENSRYEREGLDLKDLINSKKANVEKQQQEVDKQEGNVKSETTKVNNTLTAFNAAAAAVDACKPVKSSGSKKGFWSSSSWSEEKYPAEYKQLQLDKAAAKSAWEIAQGKSESAQQELALKRQNLRDAQKQLAEFETGRATGSVEAKQIIDRNKAEMATRQQEIAALQNKVTTQKQVGEAIKGELGAKKSLYDQLVRISEFFLIEESAGQDECRIVSEFVAKHKQARALFEPSEGATNSNAPGSCSPIRGEEMESVQPSLSNEVLQGLQYQQVPGDGHCLFHAIGVHLGQDAAYLRRIVAAHMEANVGTYKPYRQGTDQDFRNYIQAIREGNEWGDNIEIEVIQRITNRPVIIIRPNANPTIPNNVSSYQGEPIFIYYNDHNHYDSFILINNANPSDILTRIQTKLAQGRTITYHPIKQLVDDSLLDLSEDATNSDIPGSRGPR